ncbi:MAG: DUF4468 domain-containing protein [Bacteroides sp.]|nr:DUF4468 domain-containing protein [Bacteroides sp.]
MKKSLYLILLLFFATSCGTTRMITIDEPTIKVYTDLVDSQDDLFIKANDWMISMFVDASSVIEFSDKEGGVLIGKYLMSGEIRTGYSFYATATVDSRVYAKIDIRVRDGRARISIEPIGSWKYDDSGLTIYNYSKENFYQDMDKMMLSFENAIKAETIEF